MDLKLQFDPSAIGPLAACYVTDTATQALNDEHIEALVGGVRKRGFLEPDELQLVARWKSRRSAWRIPHNEGSFANEVTGIALSTSSERLRIEVLTLLDGVGWPTASVVLHWFHVEDYPILDFRELSSVGAPADQRYDYEFWCEYTAFCREAAREAGVFMRDLDRALWRHSYESGRP